MSTKMTVTEMLETPRGQMELRRSQEESHGQQEILLLRLNLFHVSEQSGIERYAKSCRPGGSRCILVSGLLLHPHAKCNPLAQKAQIRLKQ